MVIRSKCCVNVRCACAVMSRWCGRWTTSSVWISQDKNENLFHILFVPCFFGYFKRNDEMKRVYVCGTRCGTCSVIWIIHLCYFVFLFYFFFCVLFYKELRWSIIIYFAIGVAWKLMCIYMEKQSSWEARITTSINIDLLFHVCNLQVSYKCITRTGRTVLVQYLFYFFSLLDVKTENRDERLLNNTRKTKNNNRRHEQRDTTLLLCVLFRICF